MNVDWNKAIEVAITAAGSGGASFIGAFFRFKQRLKDAEDSARIAKEVAEAALKQGGAIALELAELKKTVDASFKGWRMEFDGFKEDYERDQQHRAELEEARAEARQSRPDPVEALRHEVGELKRIIERVRDKQGTFVRTEAFTEHTRAMEQQWRTLERTLGQLETLVKRL